MYLGGNYKLVSSDAAQEITPDSCSDREGDWGESRMTSYDGNGGGVKVGISGGIHREIKTLIPSLLANFRK